MPTSLRAIVIAACILEGISGPSATGQEVREADVPELVVTRVVLSRNERSETAEATPPAGPSKTTAEQLTEWEKIIRALRAEVAQLREELEVRGDRTALIGGRATVTLEANREAMYNGTLALDANDVFDLGGIELVAMNQEGVIHWVPYAIKESADASPTAPAQESDDGLIVHRPPRSTGAASEVDEAAGDDSSGHENSAVDEDGGSDENSAPDGDTQDGAATSAGDEEAPATPVSDATEDAVEERDRSRRTLRAVANFVNEIAEDETGGAQSPTQSDGPQGGGEVELTNVKSLTYQQPSPRWEVFYELDHRTGVFAQWVSFTNYSGYTWRADTPIDLVDSPAAALGESLHFKLSAPLKPGTRAVQRLGGITLIEEKKPRWAYRYKVGERNPARHAQLEDSEFEGAWVPDGQLREVFADGRGSTTAAVTFDEKKRELNLGIDVLISIIAQGPDPDFSGSLIEDNAGVFVVEPRRRTKFQVNFASLSVLGVDRLPEISFEAPAEDKAWRLADETAWTKVGKSFQYVFAPTGSPSEPAALVEGATEAGRKQLTWPSDQKELLKYLKASEGKTSSKERLAHLASLSASKQLLVTKIAQLETALKDLELIYRRYDVDELTVASQSNQRALLAMEKRIVALQSELETARIEHRQLTYEIDIILNTRSGLAESLPSPPTAAKGGDL